MEEEQYRSVPDKEEDERSNEQQFQQKDAKEQQEEKQSNEHVENPSELKQEAIKPSNTEKQEPEDAALTEQLVYGSQEGNAETGLKVEKEEQKEALLNQMADAAKMSNVVKVFKLDPEMNTNLKQRAKNCAQLADVQTLAYEIIGSLAKPRAWSYENRSDVYEIVLQKGPTGLCLNVGIKDAEITVLGFRKPENGLMGPAEACGMIQMGDSLIGVDGVSLSKDVDFSAVMPKLKSPFPVKLRFRRPAENTALDLPDSSWNTANAAQPKNNTKRRSLPPSSYSLPSGPAGNMISTSGGVRFVGENRWTAEVMVGAAGLQNLGEFPDEKSAIVAHNAFVLQQFGSNGFHLMISEKPINSLPLPQQLAMSKLQIKQQQQQLLNKRAAQAAAAAAAKQSRRRSFMSFSPQQKDQLRAQIMVFRYLSQSDIPPNDLLTQALRSMEETGVTGRKKKVRKKNFKDDFKPKGKPGRRRKRKKKDDYSSSSDEAFREYSRKSVDTSATASRRSSRNTGKTQKKYSTNNSDYGLSDEEEAIKEADDLKAKELKSKMACELEDEGEKVTEIDKLIGVRFHASTAKRDDEVMYFLVKWKRKSYLHCTWLAENQLENFGKRMPSRVTRFLRMNQAMLNRAKKHVIIGDDIDHFSYFSESYVEPDRILAMKEVEEEIDMTLEDVDEKKKESDLRTLEDKPKTRKGIKYLVKWKDLSYTEASWEWSDLIVDDRKIANFHRFNHPPFLANAPPALLRDVRPPCSEWAKYTQSPVYANNNTLRSYQLEGLNWMVFCWYNRRNCILADEMGLGKTIQSTAVLEHLRSREGIRGPFLVVAPLATLGNWKKELENWTTSMNCVVYHDSEGGVEARDFIRQHEFYFNDNLRARGVYKFNVLVTTYQVVITDAELFEKIHWRYVIVDEAHKLKNRDAKLLQTMKTFTSDSILLMTGTPLQNGVDELWSLLHFIEPEKFPSQADFYSRFGELLTADQVAGLHEELRPYMLRRVKEDVEKSIPPKEETVIDVELTTLQKKYYRAIFEKNRNFLNQNAKGNVANLVNVEMELRKVCNHPFLIKGVEEKESRHLITEADRFKKLMQASGKTVLLDKILTKFREENKKVLIFSQFKIMLDILEDVLESRQFRYERLDGSVKGNDRQAAINRFNDKNSKSFVFLLSTRAGGVGINLVAASVVILYDSDWNPQNDLQAVARCHRIGQTQSVQIFRLVTKKSYEAQMFEIASKKLGVHQAVFESGGVRSGFNGEDEENTAGNNQNMMSLMSLDKDKIEMMIRYGAYAIMGNEDDEEDPENEKINSASIEEILSSSRTIRYDPNKEEQSSDGKSNGAEQTASGALNFSKATFISETSDSTIDFHDDQFWEKVLGPKPVQKLSAKLQEKSFMKQISDKELREYLVELRELAKELIAQRQKGGKMEDAQEILSILVELSVMGVVKPTINVKETAKNWLDIIERPKRRRATMQDPNKEEDLMYHEFLDGVKKRKVKTAKKAVLKKKEVISGGEFSSDGEENDEEEEEEASLSEDEESDLRKKGKNKSKKSMEKLQKKRKISKKRANSTMLKPSAEKKAKIKKRKEDNTDNYESGIIITCKKKNKNISDLEGSPEVNQVEQLQQYKIIRFHSSIYKVRKALKKGIRDKIHQRRNSGNNKPSSSPCSSTCSDKKKKKKRKEEITKASKFDTVGSCGIAIQVKQEEGLYSILDIKSTQSEIQHKLSRFKKKKTKIKVLDPAIDDQMWCRVCFSDEGFFEDPIVQCEDCKISVHKLCYGIQEVPEGDDPWFCDLCSSEEATQPVNCILCPLKRRTAVKKTVEGEWVHIVCAIWASGVEFQNASQMDQIAFVPQAAERAIDSICTICRDKGGCIQCAESTCIESFHPICGRESKQPSRYRMFMSDSGKLLAYCPHHSAD